MLIWSHSLKTNRQTTFLVCCYQTATEGRFALPFLLPCPGVLELQTRVTVRGVCMYLCRLRRHSASEATSLAPRGILTLSSMNLTVNFSHLRVLYPCIQASRDGKYLGRKKMASILTIYRLLFFSLFPKPCRQTGW